MDDETDDNRAVPMRVRMQRPLMDAIEEFGRRTGASRSAAARELICAGLAKQGLWPPAPARRGGAA